MDMGMLGEVPIIKMPKRAKGAKQMKGRPITTEEFERMIAKTPDIVGEAAAPSWQHYLTGLWWSGLRLGKSLNLWWDRDDKLGVDLDGRRPMFRILTELEKGNQDRDLPMAPEFAEFLHAVPEVSRTGPVFRPAGMRGRSECRSSDWVSRIICRIGKAAGIKVNTDPLTGTVKYASAHDFRRSFGTRWAPKVKPVTLQLLMRHEDINTTLSFYVGLDAEAVADELWSVYEPRVNTFVNSGADAPDLLARKKAANHF